MARRTVSLIVNEHSGISAEMALRLSKALRTTPELWLNMQQRYDLWHAGQQLSLNAIKQLSFKKRPSSAASAVTKGSPVVAQKATPRKRASAKE